ncbi:MAG: TlpA family protein disulfide reductase, partial [Lachnospiraceae bacterium]|nr:TlpA family protein disulfide reductase [Lachnospiraceae bacterium]
MKRWKMIVSASLLAGSVMSAAVSAEDTVNFENPGSEMLVDAPVSYEGAGGEVIVDAPVSYEDAGGEVLGDAPVTPPAQLDTNMVGKTLDFLSTDLEGSRVIGKTLYADNTITLVILWGTWSPECMNVLPELAQLQERLQEKGCGIVGLDYETTLEGDEALQAAKAALDECGIEYPNAVMPTKLNEKVIDYPTAFFVNRDGIVLTAPITGADVGSFESTINALLEGTIQAAAQITPGNSAAQAAGNDGTAGGMTQDQNNMNGT